MKKFREIKQDVENLNPEPSNFRNHVLPLARIKKIMKMDEEVKMISVETPLLISKACELFIIELAYRGWAHTIEGNRRTLQRNRCHIGGTKEQCEQVMYMHQRCAIHRQRLRLPAIS